MNINIIVAMTKDRVIGMKGKIPWNIPEDMKLFREHTTDNTVIMGKNTYFSIPNKFRPLPNRNNIVVSTTMSKTKGIDVCTSLEEAIEKAKTYKKDAFIIGGAQLYNATLPIATKMYISHIKEYYSGDTYFPQFDYNNWIIERRDQYVDFVLAVYRRKK